ncbi:hypothetical protein [Prosthecobacter dejongeii]|uniref:Uncharacterized protein n=1 Tax=Prosthecobacter dejongeii TaxID=48465 RepID=A0A7W7YLV8_9BACT|nr:hypothetical protein [Prosthecobacter dejongeii]MBB5038605.1 hypothetical protein [Prosthecobacter dejongeii]
MRHSNYFNVLKRGVLRQELPARHFHRKVKSKIMVDSEQALDYLEQQIPSLSAAAVDVAYWQALASGQAVLVREEGGIYQAFPDGTRKLIKVLEAPLSVPIGTRVRLP